MAPGNGPSGGRYIPIGEVNRIRGVRGEVVVTVHADDPARMARLASLFVDDGGEYREVRVESVKRLGPRAVLKLSGYGSPEEARRLVGKALFIPPEASTPAPPGRYYAYQLEGLTARLKDGRVVGKVREVLSQGGQTLLVLEGEEGREILIPFVRAICVECDPEAGFVILDPPEGLIELNRRQAVEDRST